MHELTFRAARKSEARVIAALYRIASDGVADYVWTRLAKPGEALLDVGARRYAREGTDFSYQNVTVAEVAGEIAGMMAAYPLRPAHRAPDEFDFEVDAVLRPIDRLEQPESFYISGTALFPAYRGRGVGQRFLALAAERARAFDLGQISLIVFEQNVRARRLYERAGFREVKRERLVPHPLLHYGGDVLLLVRNL